VARLLHRLGALAHRRRIVFLLLWLVILAAAGAGAMALGGHTTTAISIPGQESTNAQDRIKTEFDSGGASAQVVVKAPAGQTLTTPANAKTVGDLVTKLSGLPGVRSASNPLNPQAPAIHAKQTTAYSTVTYKAAMGDVTADEQQALLDAVNSARANGFTAEVTGAAITDPTAIGGAGELIGVVVALVILALTYGSLIAAGMNLLTAAVGVGIGALGVTIATGFMDLQSTTPILATMLGLAVGIDYALFIISRFRQELGVGAEVGPAIATAVGTAGTAVVTAGSTVVIALACLSVAGIPFLTQMGIAAALTIAVAVLVAITLVPAVLSLLGRRALPRKPARDRGFQSGWIRTVLRRPVSALLLAVIALGVLAIPAASMHTTLVPAAAQGSTQAKAIQLLSDAFGEGFNGPLVVLFEGPDAAATAQQAAPTVQKLDDVAIVAPAVPDKTGTAALLTVIPKSGPTSTDTERLVSDLRSHLAGFGGATVSVTGATAVSVDVATSLDHALPIYLLLVVGLALILLILVFRSLLVPLVGVLGFLLTIGASLGATVAVFQWGWLSGLVNLDSAGPLISLTPIIVTGILFGLAMDYQVFLVSRMHEAHHRGLAAREAITTGFRQAAPVVVAAALIMFSVFAGFVPAGEATVKSIAFALAIGILFDAFVVRMILVPAALALLGKAAWWLPSWLRWLPSLDLEGSRLAEEPEREMVDA
jgi:RND superfamily putative drug exporter